MSFFSSEFPSLWLVSCLAAPAYLGCLAVYRLFFHPLRAYPGPRLAALTDYYVAYYDIVKNGGIIEQLEKLHKKYGPVVRFAPNELHFNNPRAYAPVYSHKFTKDSKWYSAFVTNLSVFGLIDPREVKKHRDVLSPFFSRQSVLKLEYLVQEKVSKLISKLSGHIESKDVVNMHYAFRCTTLDVITSYTFAESVNSLDYPGFEDPLLDGIEASLIVAALFRHFPIILHIFRYVPPWLLPSSVVVFGGLQDKIASLADKYMEDPSLLQRDVPHEIIYHHLISPQKMKQVTLSRAALLQESQIMIVAGSDTVGNTCMFGAFYIYRNPAIRERLYLELQEAWPEPETPMGYQQLEKLTYLTAVIKESLRVSMGVAAPMRRVSDADNDVLGFKVPAGAVVSIGAPFVHESSDIFRDPLTFNPDRWLGPESHDLDNYLVAFSKGPRVCIGMNLAWCELYLIFANLYRKLDLDFCDTTNERLSYREHFVPILHRSDIETVVTGKRF